MVNFIWIMLSLGVGAVGGFVVGFLVYRKNGKKFETMMSKVQALPAEQKKQLEEWIKNLPV